jgi:hypothetical protein
VSGEGIIRGRYKPAKCIRVDTGGGGAYGRGGGLVKIRNGYVRTPEGGEGGALQNWPDTYFMDDSFNLSSYCSICSAVNITHRHDKKTTITFCGAIWGQIKN